MLSNAFADSFSTVVVIGPANSREFWVACVAHPRQDMPATKRVTPRQKLACIPILRLIPFREMILKKRDATPTLNRTLKTIARHIKDNKCSPTIDELTAKLTTSKFYVQEQIKQLIAMNLLRKTYRKARSLELVSRLILKLKFDQSDLWELPLRAIGSIRLKPQWASFALTSRSLEIRIADPG